jgi:hypothetical protein
LGERRVRVGEWLYYDFSLLFTSFKTISTDRQWATRFYHRYEPVDRIAAKGANTINVHHATEINPYINYPFLRPAAMKAYVDSAHAVGSRVKIYYTVRELSNRAPELHMLRSLGTEILSGGPGGGFSWLQEHLDRTISPPGSFRSWDAALSRGSRAGTTTTSRASTGSPATSASTASISTTWPSTGRP